MEIDLKELNNQLNLNNRYISQNIRKHRKNCGLTQQDLAFYLFMDKSRVSDIENQRAGNVTIYTLLKFCQFFNINLSELFEE